MSEKEKAAHQRLDAIARRRGSNTRTLTTERVIRVLVVVGQLAALAGIILRSGAIYCDI